MKSIHAFQEDYFPDLHILSIKLIPTVSHALGSIMLDGGPYHTESSPLICSANRWSGFYMIDTSVTRLKSGKTPS